MNEILMYKVSLMEVYNKLNNCKTKINNIKYPEISMK